jgi:APA family basic amino acid/polyamine antiporter
LLAFGLITFVGEVPALGGTTALLLLCVFTVVNIAVLVLRRDRVTHEHFRTPTLLPLLGALSCAFLAGPWTGRNPVQYRVAGVLIGIGIVLWLVTVVANRRHGSEDAGTRSRRCASGRASELSSGKSLARPAASASH